jgi:hypothetical protein
MPVIENILEIPSTISTKKDATYHLVVIETLEDYRKVDITFFIIYLRDWMFRISLQEAC